MPGGKNVKHCQHQGSHLRLEVVWYPVFCLDVFESESCHKRTLKIQFFITIRFKLVMHFSHSHGVKLCGSSWNHLQTPLAAAWFSPFFSWNLGKLSSSLSPFARGDFKGVQESIGGNFATGSCPLWRNITEVPLDFFTTCRLCCRPSWPHPHKKKWTQTNPTKYTQNLKSVSVSRKTGEKTSWLL